MDSSQYLGRGSDERSSADAPFVSAGRCSIFPVEAGALRTALSAAQKALQQVVLRKRTAKDIRQLTRLTVIGEDGSALQEAFSQTEITTSYDILAVQPMNEKALQLACTTLPVDIIALDLSRRLSYRLKSTVLSAALSRGVFFEVVWSEFLCLSICN